MSDRSIMNPDARSPYQKYGKTPFKFPAWVAEGRQPPADIQAELRVARNAAAQAFEERYAKKKRDRTGRTRRAPADRAAAAE